MLPRMESKLPLFLTNKYMGASDHAAHAEILGSGRLRQKRSQQEHVGKTPQIIGGWMHIRRAAAAKGSEKHPNRCLAFRVISRNVCFVQTTQKEVESVAIPK